MPLSDRLGGLPLVLAGPILRRVESGSVTVWLALKESRQVTLQVLGADGTTVQFSGTRATVAIGRNLHLVAVTAERTGSQSALTGGQMYYYNVSFGSGTNLASPGVLSAPGGSDGLNRIAYQKSGAPLLPGFALPPAELADLRVVTGSCRKPHGPSLDALRTLHGFLDADAHDPIKRPHQLFLTGDQIYADDVADAILPLLTDAGDVLLNRDATPGSREQLPGFPGGPKAAADVRPGRRAKDMEETAGFTSSEARSHLLGLGEFCAMYLFVWSDVLWPAQLPTYAEVFPGQPETVRDPTGRRPPRPHPDAKLFAEQLRPVGAFVRSLPRIRKALANVPTYMIPDDHEVTDDWYLHRAWMERVIGKPLARRVIQNGLLGIVLFQAWGNTPAQFAAPTSTGGRLLSAVAAWTAAGFPATSADLQQIETALPLPPTTLNPPPEDIVINGVEKVQFHFSIAWDKHQVLALDTRTWRSFPRSSRLRAVLFTEDGLFEQMKAVPPPITDGVLFVLLPGPVPVLPVVDAVFGVLYFIADLPILGLPLLGGAEGVSFSLDGRLEGLTLDPGMYERTLLRLATRRPPAAGARTDRCVVLSGDVHHGFAVWQQYWANRPLFEPNAPPARADVAFAHLTTSPLQNTTAVGLDFSALLHDEGFEYFSDGVPEETQRLTWALESTDPTQGKLEVGTKRILGNIDGKLKADIERQGRLAVIEDTADATSFFTSATVTRTPDVVSRSLFIQSSDERAPPEDVLTINSLPSGVTSKRERLQALLDASRNHAFAYTQRTAPGKQVVGHNHLSLIRLVGLQPGGTEANKAVIQEFWWWLGERAELFAADGNPATEKIAAPLSRFRVPLGINAPPVIGDL